MRWLEQGRALALVVLAGALGGCGSAEPPPASTPDPAMLRFGAPGTVCTRGNCRNGIGILARIGGESYAGEFRDGLPNGTGALTFPGGPTYFGGFVDGRMQGEGTYRGLEGDTYVGAFVA